jgi:tRNA(fMet)-specific endonuclease VapC
MKYLLDTDHLSVLQRQTGEAYLNFSTRMSQCVLSDFAVSVVTFHEQFIGIHTYINRSRGEEELLRGYAKIVTLLKDFMTFSVVPFDRLALDEFRNLQRQKVGGSTMDLRIASIAFSRSLILLTRNQKDFNKIPGLQTQDWTANS